MRKFIIIISVFILISNGYTYAAAEEVSETANLKKAADDMNLQMPSVSISWKNMTGH
jgi:hypothetical protein